MLAHGVGERGDIADVMALVSHDPDAGERDQLGTDGGGLRYRLEDGAHYEPSV